MPRRIVCLAALLLCLSAQGVLAVQPEEVNPARRHTHLHFSHPLVAESPTPDTKIRFDYIFTKVDNDERVSDDQMLRLEAEYAFNENVSVEIHAPFTFTNPSDEPNENNFGDVEVAIKLASYALESHGLVIGGGIELVLPTGDDDKNIGNDHTLHIEPFITAGYKKDSLEVIASLGFGIPTNEPEAEKDEEDLELEFNLSVLYHFTPRIEGLIELDGSSVVSGHEEETVVNLTPGIKVRPIESSNLIFGLGVSFPISNDKNFDSRVLLSMFCHF